MGGDGHDARQDRRGRASKGRRGEEAGDGSARVVGAERRGGEEEKEEGVARGESDREAEGEVEACGRGEGGACRERPKDSELESVTGSFKEGAHPGRGEGRGVGARGILPSPKVPRGRPRMFPRRPTVPPTPAPAFFAKVVCTEPRSGRAPTAASPPEPSHLPLSPGERVGWGQGRVTLIESSEPSLFPRGAPRVHLTHPRFSRGAGRPLTVRSEGSAGPRLLPFGEGTRRAWGKVAGVGPGVRSLRSRCRVRLVPPPLLPSLRPLWSSGPPPSLSPRPKTFVSPALSPAPSDSVPLRLHLPRLLSGSASASPCF